MNGIGRIALIGIAAALFGTACRQASPPAVPADAWATVNGETVTQDEVDKAFRRVQDPAQTPTAEEVLAAKLTLLDDLILQEILLGKARDLKIELPAAELDKAYADARANLSEDAFKQELTRRNVTADDLRESLRRDGIVRKVLEQEVNAKVTVTDQEIADFFNANRAQFNLPEEAYHLAQIVVTPARDQQIANRTGDDAATPQAAAAKLQMLMQRLKEGAAFGDLARDYSEDPESAPRGGDLGLVPVSAVRQAAPALRDAVLKLSPGQARIASGNGAHTIVYVVAHEPAGQRELTTPGVKERITAGLRETREQLLRTAYLSAARADADITNHQARRIVEAKGKP